MTTIMMRSFADNQGWNWPPEIACKIDGSGKSFQTASVEKQNGPGIKGDGNSWFYENKNGHGRTTSSHSPARKAASAVIAKIPFPLAQYIAQCWRTRYERLEHK